MRLSSIDCVAFCDIAGFVNILDCTDFARDIADMLVWVLCIQLVITITEHVLYEKVLQRLKGVGPLVCSQEQRALLVPRFNRSSTVRCVPLLV